MGAFVPANNNPGLSSLRSTLLLKRAARGLGRFVVRFSLRALLVAGLQDWYGRGLV